MSEPKRLRHIIKIEIGFRYMTLVYRDVGKEGKGGDAVRLIITR